MRIPGATLKRLRQPIELPDIDAPLRQAVQDIATLQVRRDSYQRIASIVHMPQWPEISKALEQMREQYTEKLVVVKGDDVIRCQEAIKVYQFLLGMPDAAQSRVSEIDRSLEYLRETIGFDDED